MSFEIGDPLAVEGGLSVIENNHILERYKIYPAYPNPFNPFITIHYDIIKNQTIGIIIHDMRGKKVKDLFYGEKSRGYHNINWNGKNDKGETVSSGIYYYTIRTEEWYKTEKIIYLK